MRDCFEVRPRALHEKVFAPAALSAADADAFKAACELVVEGKTSEGIGALLKLAAAQPYDCAIAHALGSAYRVMQDAATARTWLRKAAELDPDDSLSWKDLAEVASQARDWAEVARACSHRVRLDRRCGEAWVLWGHALHAQRRTRAALCVMLAGWRHNRNHTRLNAGIGSYYTEIGRSYRGLAFLRQAVAIDPAYDGAWTNLLFAITGDGRSNAEQQAAEHRRYGERWQSASKLTPRRRTSRAKIRVGYVSGDFRRHALERFYAPVFDNLDREKFEIYLYSNTSRYDASTARYRTWCTHWRDVSESGDDEAWRMVTRDRVDILVDLSGHTRGNRLGIFARRAAPVQITHCGYPNTSGLAQMDWFVTDSQADPPGTERFFTEKLVRIDPCFLCYSPASREVSAETEAGTRPVTFGCFNPLRKISEATLDLWARVLERSEGSRLLLKSRALGDPAVAMRTGREFARRGIAPDRIGCAGFSNTDEDYLRAWHDVDIALDPFPYNGGTITCDALWMGVPVVAKTGDTHASRVASSLLHAAGYAEWIANSDDSYVRIASSLGEEVATLRGTRGARRDRMRGSVLMDETSYARRFEEALRSLMR